MYLPCPHSLFSSVTLLNGHFSVPMSRSPGVNTRRRKEPFELQLCNGLFITAGRHKGSAPLTSKGGKQEVNNIQGPIPSIYFLQLDSTSQRSYSLQKHLCHLMAKPEPMGDISFPAHPLPRTAHGDSCDWLWGSASLMLSVIPSLQKTSFQPS